MNRREFGRILAGAAVGSLALPKSRAYSDGKPIIWDGFCHFSSTDYFNLLLALNGPTGNQQLLAQQQLTLAIPELTSVPKRLAAMNDTGVAVSVLTSQPFVETAPVVCIDPVKALQAAQFINNFMASTFNGQPRFKWVAQLPVNLPSNDANYQLMVGELRRCLSIGAVGGCFTVAQNVKAPDHPDFIGDGSKLGLFGEAWKLGVPLWMHPCRSGGVPDFVSDSPPVSRYNLSLQTGWLLDESNAIIRIGLSNVFAKYPGLMLISHHKGALIPIFQTRESYDLNTFYNINTAGLPADVPPPYTQTYQNFIVDTVASANRATDAATLKSAVDFFGLRHVVFGTDSSFSPDGGRYGTQAAIASVKDLELPPEAEQAIFSGNLVKILQKR
jgi:uncharacterized protein